ncbi:hypothetical protein OB949_01440 [Aeromonas hydrophila]|nr:hypothetical protein [Aeromonas hydrophila]MDM5116934.1 hypothetical protein [Aeromonas hydrophila]
MALYSLLDQLAIPYQRIDHPPVFTCEEASRLLPKLQEPLPARPEERATVSGGYP